MSILFVTSFDRSIYNQSGKKLIRTFLKEQQIGRLLICDEGMEGHSYSPERLERVSLDRDEWLRDWLKANADIIPEHLGGLAKECDCEQRGRMHGEHKHGCHWQWMNRNASRFLRKVASLRQAIDRLAGYHYVVWLDADCVFQRTLTTDHMEEFLAGQPFFYFRAHREAPETGIIGFRVCSEGDGFNRVAGQLWSRYESKEFRTDHRWDDGFQLGRLIDLGIVRGHDLAADCNCRNNHVMTFTPMWKIVRHVKGSHGRLMENRGQKPIMR